MDKIKGYMFESRYATASTEFKGSH